MSKQSMSIIDSPSFLLTLGWSERSARLLLLNRWSDFWCTSLYWTCLFTVGWSCCCLSGLGCWLRLLGLFFLYPVGFLDRLSQVLQTFLDVAVDCFLKGSTTWFLTLVSWSKAWLIIVLGDWRGYGHLVRLGARRHDFIVN